MNLNDKPVNRLFTYGCSFTKYFWPTWADILNHQVKPQEYHNWALPGAGNAYISHSFHLNNIEHNYGPEDLIVICWTNIFRNDWFIDFEWSQEGNVYSTYGKYNSLLTEDLKNQTIFFIRDIMNIYSVMQACDQAGCRHKHLAMLPMFEQHDEAGRHLFIDSEYERHDVKPLLDYIMPRLEKSFFEVLGDQVKDKWYSYFPEDEFQRPLLWDRHPMPTHHLKYLKEVFANTVFDYSLQNTVQSSEDQVVELLLEHNRDTDKFQELFESNDKIILGGPTC